MVKRVIQILAGERARRGWRDIHERLNLMDDPHHPTITSIFPEAAVVFRIILDPRAWSLHSKKEDPAHQNKGPGRTSSKLNGPFQPTASHNWRVAAPFPGRSYRYGERCMPIAGPAKGPDPADVRQAGSPRGGARPPRFACGRRENAPVRRAHGCAGRSVGT